MVSFKKKIQAKKKSEEKSTAQERIKILFKLAEESAGGDEFSQANDYVKKARKIGMKTRVKIPSLLKRKFCKYCYSYLAGQNSRVRTDPKNKRVVVKCKDCGREMYFPYVREVKERRKKKLKNVIDN